MRRISFFGGLEKKLSFSVLDPKYSSSAFPLAGSQIFIPRKSVEVFNNPFFKQNDFLPVLATPQHKSILFTQGSIFETKCSFTTEDKKEKEEKVNYEQEKLGWPKAQLDELVDGITRILQQVKGLLTLSGGIIGIIIVLSAALILLTKFIKEEKDREYLNDLINQLSDFIIRMILVLKGGDTKLLDEYKAKLKDRDDKLKKYENQITPTDVEKIYNMIKAIQDELAHLEPDVDTVRNKLKTVVGKYILEEEKNLLIKKYDQIIASKEKEINNLKNAIKQNDQQEIEKDRKLLSNLEKQKEDLEKNKSEAIKKVEYLYNENDKLQTILLTVISNQEFNKYDMRAIRKAWHQESNFKDLQLSWAGSQCISVIMQKKWLKSLAKEVDFSQCHLNQYDNNIANLIKPLSELPIEKLILEHNHLGYKGGGKAVADIIQNTQSIKILVLNNNSLKDNDIQLIAEALKVNTTIEHLELHSNSFGTTGYDFLQDVFDHNSTLMKINVKNNYSKNTWIERSTSTPRPGN